jgi:hypothetical protein
MISKKAIIAWVFSAVVGVGMLASPSRALAHDHDGDGDGGGGHHQQLHHDNGQHRGWYNHQNNETRGYNQRYYGNGFGSGNGYSYGNQEPDGDDGYGWNQPNYNYRQPGYGYNYPSNGAGMVNRRNPNLVWACDSQGHHCHWARRYGYNGYNSGLNPFAFNGANNGYANNYGNYGNGYYGGNNGNYGNSMGGLGSLLGPLFGGQQP